jgi:hypothetical protein
MRFIARRPALLAMVTMVAMLAARAGHHAGRGFHNW